MKKIKMITAVLFTAFLVGCSTNLKDGVTYLEEGKYEEAVDAFHKAIEESKYGEQAYRGAGIAYFEMGEYEEALGYFESAFSFKKSGEKFEETPSIYAMKAACHLHLGELEEALELYQQALELECPEEMRQEILFNEIAIYQELGDWDMVKEKTVAYVEVYPDDTRMDKTVEFLETR